MGCLGHWIYELFGANTYIRASRKKETNGMHLIRILQHAWMNFTTYTCSSNQ